MTVQCEGRPPAAILTPTSGEGEDMARGKRVRIDGRDRTIPADQVPRYDAMVAALAGLYPGDEHAHELKSAADTATRYLLGDEGATRRVAADLAEAREQTEAATAAARALILLAAEDGATEVGLAADLGIDRLTVRKYRGKKDRR